MAKFKEKFTKVEIEGLLLEEFLNEKFLEELKKRGLTIKPAAIVLLSETEQVTEKESKDKNQSKPKKEVYPILFEHNSNLDYQNKILKVSCDDSDSFKKVVETIKELHD